EKNSDLGDLPAPAQDLPAPPEVLSYPKRRPSKRRRKTTTPIPIEEEYLLTAKKATAVPSIPPSHMPENIEEIIEQEPPQDTLKIKEKINSVPPVLVIPTESASPLLIPLPTVMTLLPKNITKRRKRRKRIRTSTSSYEDVEEKNGDLGDLPAPAQDLPAPPEVLSYPKRRPSKRRRKTTTPVPIEEEYLLTAKKATAVPSIAPSHMPENIEEIIEQEPPQDTLKIKQKNSVPPVLVIPTESASPLLIPLPTVMTLLPKNITKLEESHPVPVNFSQSLTPDLLTPHGKQNKINVRLSEPILFVTAPQAADYVELPEATPPPPVRTVPSKPTTTASTVNVVTSTTPKIPVVVTSTTQPTKEHNKTAETPKNTIVKKPAPLNITRDNITTSTEKINIEVKKPIRRPPPVGTLFRKRLQPTPHTSTESANITTSTEKINIEVKKPIRRPPPVGTLFRKRLQPTPHTSTESAIEVKKPIRRPPPVGTLFRKRLQPTPHTSTESAKIVEEPEVKKPIRRPPPVGTLFRKRLQPTPHTSTESAKIVEEQTTVSKENELAELKLYTESPLELQKVGAVKLNEIPPTSKINTHKLLKENNVHEKDLSDSSLYKKDDLRIKSTPTPTSTPAKHTQTSGTHIAYTPNIDLIIDYTSSTRKPTTTSTEHSIRKVGAVKLNEIPPTSKINTHKLLKENNVHEKDLSDSSLYKKDDLRIKSTPTPTPTPTKHTQTSGTHIAYTPNIDLIIDYTSSTRKPTTTSTEHSIRVVTSEDESLNTISTSHNSEPGKSSGEDEAVRINLEIPQVKDDILIFLKSKAESNKLSKILQSRNMTLNELIDHRERGSSQLHLANYPRSFSPVT
ncbi:mucin-2-like, partial [Diaphorina citri]|uniref:Mucin-2-like n=1 Tax=Diaphorina citri TaxID=121845 RepID=A0A1S3DDF1_DIACI